MKQWKSNETRIQESLLLAAEGTEHSEKVHGNQQIYPDCAECLRLAKAVLDALGVDAQEFAKDLEQRGAPKSIKVISNMLARQENWEDSAWNQKH